MVSKFGCGFALFQKLAAECVRSNFSGTLIPYKCDLSVEEEILSMFSSIKSSYRGIDVCINNAGLAHPEPLLTGKTSGWRNMIDVSSTGRPEHRCVVTEVSYQRRNSRPSKKKSPSAYTVSKEGSAVLWH